MNTVSFPAIRAPRGLACALALTTAAVAQQATTLFDAPVVAFDEWTSIRKLADLDGDGRVEALGWWYTTNYSDTIYASTYRQGASGVWSLAWRESIALGAGTLRDPVLDVGNFDGDDRADWALSLKTQLRVYTSQADGTPSLLWSTTEALIERVLVRDFDGDGRDDLAVVTAGYVRLLRNAGGTFAPTGMLTLPTLTGPFELEPGDVNGDATPDLLLTDATSLRLIRIENNAPVLAATFAHGLSQVKPAAGDIDGDGDRDIVLWGMDPDRYVVMRRTGPATFTQEPSVIGD